MRVRWGAEPSDEEAGRAAGRREEFVCSRRQVLTNSNAQERTSCATHAKAPPLAPTRTRNAAGEGGFQRSAHAQSGGLRPLILDMSSFHEPSRWGMYGSSSFIDSWPDMDMAWLR